MTDLNLQLDPLERIVFDGVASRLQTVLKCPFVWSSASDTIQVVKRIFGTDKVRYPYGSLLLRSWEEATDRGNTTASARRGRISVITTNQKRFYRVLYLPVDFSVEGKFVTNSYGDILRAANAILFSRRSGWLKFAAAYGGNSFDISVLPEQSIQMPESTGDQDTAKEYELTFQMTVNGFISHPELLEGQVIDTLEESVLLGTDESSLSDPTTTDLLWVNPAASARISSIRFTDLPANVR